MSCAFDNIKRAREIDRVRRLAKSLAKMEDVMVVITLKDDNTYDFHPISQPDDKPIIEYITPY